MQSLRRRPLRISGSKANKSGQAERFKYVRSFSAPLTTLATKLCYRDTSTRRPRSTSRSFCNAHGRLQLLRSSSPSAMVGLLLLLTVASSLASGQHLLHSRLPRWHQWIRRLVHSIAGLLPSHRHGTDFSASCRDGLLSSLGYVHVPRIQPSSLTSLLGS